MPTPWPNASIAELSTMESMLAPAAEAARLQALHRTRLLDSPPEAAFDRLTRLVCRLLHVPVALFSLVDADRQFFKSNQGLADPWATQRQTPLSHSFCRYQIALQQPLAVDDAREHPFLRNNPAIEELGVVAYLGVPLYTPDGYAIGSLCAIDHHPHAWSKDELDSLSELSTLVMDEIELRLQALERQPIDQKILLQTRMLDAVEQAITAVDQNGVVIYWNRFAENLYQQPAANVIGRNIDALFTSPVLAAQVTAIVNHLRTGAGWAGEFNIQRRDGSYFPVHVNASPLYDEQGKLIGYVGLAADISQHKRTQAALRAGETRFRATFEQAAVGIAHIDLQGRYLRVNNRLCTMLGYSRFELLNKSLNEMINPHDRALDGRPRAQLLAGEIESYTLEARFQHKNDALIWVNVTISLVCDEQTKAPSYLIAVIEDISSRKAAARALIVAEREQTELLALLESLLAYAPLGFAVFDREHRYVRINQTLAALNRLPPEAHLGHTPGEIVPSLAAMIDPAIEHVFTTGQALQQIELSRKHHPAPHALRHWLISFYPVIGEKQPIYVGVMVVEVTGQKQAEAELKMLNQMLEQRVAERTEELTLRNAELDQFAYVASHDLKAPLRAIEHLAAWINEDVGDLLPARSKQHLAKLRNRTTRMVRLLDDLLLYARAGRFQYSTHRVDIGAMLADIIRLVTPPQGFNVTVQGPMPVFVTSRVPLEMVLRNLIDNAIKHHHRADGWVYITANQPGNMLEFAVVDDGPGIDPIFHERIFQMFQSLQSHDLVEGSGMGLAVVKKTVEGQGGSLRVASSKDQGATFYFTWPK